jgi:hypothetical protein
MNAETAAQLLGAAEEMSELDTDKQTSETGYFDRTIIILPRHQRFRVIVVRDAPPLLPSLPLQELV